MKKNFPAITWKIVLGFAVALVTIGTILYSINSSTALDQTKLCRERLRALLVTMEVYAHERQSLPTAEDWCDLLTKYHPADEPASSVMKPHQFVCPADRTGEQCSYGYNSNLAGLKGEFGDLPPQTVVLVECPSGWNQHVGPNAITSPLATARFFL